MIVVFLWYYYEAGGGIVTLHNNISIITIVAINSMELEGHSCRLGSTHGYH